jgi:hypothetical protein
MDRRWREALLSYLPKHAYLTPTGQDGVDARWTNPQGRFRLLTARINSEKSPFLLQTRVVVIEETNGECVTLMTEDQQRIVAALNLLGAL